jgi:protoporphyrinogen oxidase
MKILIIGAGPAGLTAAYELARNGQQVTLIEKDKQVGGISKTINYKGYYFDLGGHRFFTKYPEVEKIWKEILPNDFLKRPRLSRIYYNGKYFYYPLKPLNAFINLGPLKAASAILSYAKARIKPYKNPDTFEKWVVNQFGQRLYETFFKTYTEKVWGIPCSQISADWAAQRIKGLSLSKAILNAFGLTGKNKIRTLIEEFLYPRRGPGQFWEAMAEMIQRLGGQVILQAEVRKIRLEASSVKVTIYYQGKQEEIAGDKIITSAPLSETIMNLEPKAPDVVNRAAQQLRYRDFFTVCLVIKERDTFPDNWVYVHSPEITAGRMQNFKNWSPEMVPDLNHTSLGLEYFCFSSDPIWTEPDQKLLDLAMDDIQKLKIADKNEILDGTVVRVPNAYPVYDPDYKTQLSTIKDYLNQLSLIQVIGRNGLHRYNNQDHSMMMGLYAAWNILGENFSVWDINLEEEYHEQKFE